MDGTTFRNAMGKFATGVTVITTEVEGKEHGMTANAFMSLSLDPMMVVISVGDKAQMLEKIKRSKKYAVNILAENQQELSMIFAGQINENKKVDFDRLEGLPVLKGALVQVTCDVTKEHVEGDHTLFIGKVTNIHMEEGEPLLFNQGKYGKMKLEKTLN